MKWSIEFVHLRTRPRFRAQKPGCRISLKPIQGYARYHGHIQRKDGFHYDDVRGYHSFIIQQEVLDILYELLREALRHCKHHCWANNEQVVHTLTDNVI